MTPASRSKVYIALGVLLSLSWRSWADNEIQDRSKYRYGYVIAHKGGSTQAHLESRDGDLALGRYYVRLQNGTAQKVTYFADDLGFHSGVAYSSSNGKGFSNTRIAVGRKALAAFGDPDGTQNTPAISLTPTLLFGKKILKAALNAATPHPGTYPQLNYTPIPGGFFLTHAPVEASKDPTERPGHVSASPSRALPPQHQQHPQGPPPQPNANTQTFYSTPHTEKNSINQLHLESTTPSIITHPSLPPQDILSTPGEPQGVRVSSYATGLNDLSYSNQKSLEKTNFADIDAQLISEVQKHAEEIILKDLQRSQSDAARRPTPAPHPSTASLQPIVVTNDGETGVNLLLPTTPAPEPRKSAKGAPLDSINAVKATEKDSDQALQDSGLFRVSLSPSLTSSINVSQAPHQSINADSADRNSDSNNSTLCGFNLCEKDSSGAGDLSETKPKEVEASGSLVSDVPAGSAVSNVVHAFYPENQLHAERHYVTTIDVQKAISLDVSQDEAGSIHFAQNFPFNKIKPFAEGQGHSPTPQPLLQPQIAVSPLVPQLSINLLGPPQQQYVLNTVTAAPALVHVPNQNIAVLHGLNDISGQYSPAFQERVGTNRFEYENQLVVPPPPVDITNQPTNDLRQSPQEDLKQIDQSIQGLRQQILSDIDAQHEEEQRKQSLVDQERKQYFQSLQKVEALKQQNSITYSLPVQQQANVIQATAPRGPSAETVSDVQLVPQTQYAPPPQIPYDSPPQTQYQQPHQTHFDSSAQDHYDQPPRPVFTPSTHTYQTEIKDFRHEVAVPEPALQQVSNLNLYQKPALPYSPETQTEPRQYALYETQNTYPVDNNLQQSAPAEKVQLTNYAPPASPIPPLALHQPYAVTTPTEKPKHLTISALPPQRKDPSAKTLLLNPPVPLDYTRLVQPLSLLSYPVSFPSYPLPQQLPLSLEVPPAYKLTYPPATPPQRPTNKLRVQPLKPSLPDDSGQREAVQNLLSHPHFHKTYYYPGLPINNRLQLRHARKNQPPAPDQLRSPSVRRAKSLSNLRIEYGFKPPLRPSVEFSEEVKPSIYGPSVQPH